MNKIDELIEKLCPNGVPYINLQEVAEIGTGRSDRKEAIENGEYPFYVRSQDILRINKYEFDEVAIVIPGEGRIGEIFHYVAGKYALHQRAYRIHVIDNRLNTKYLYYYMSSMFKDFITPKAVTATVTSIRKPMIEAFPVAVPPLEIQNEIVSILDKFTELLALLKAELKARKKQYAYYREKLFANENIEYKTLKDLAINCDYQRQPITSTDREKGEYPYYGASGIIDYVNDYIFDGDYLLISEDGANLISRKTPIAFSITGKNWVNNHAHVLKFDDMYIQKYVEIYLNYINLEQYISRAAQPKLNQENLNKILIPIPDNKTLINIVDILSKFDKLINDLSEGIPAEIEARQKQYEYYRDKLLTFKELVIDE